MQAELYGPISQLLLSDRTNNPRQLEEGLPATEWAGPFGSPGGKSELSGRDLERKGGRRSFQVVTRSEKAEGGAFRSRRGAKRRKAELSGRDAERKRRRRSEKAERAGFRPSGRQPDPALKNSK